MAMSGADGKRFSLQQNLGSGPLGALKLNKILPPLIVVGVVGTVAYFTIKRLRGERLGKKTTR